MSPHDFAHVPLSWHPARADLAGGPVYLALAAALERDIASGRLPPGTRLPPQRELADDLEINFTTVTRAFDLCREKGLIYGVVGRGTFVASLPGVNEEAVRTAVDLGVVQGFPGLGARAVVEAARTVLARDSAERLFSYGERDGTERVREAGRRWLARVGVEASTRHIAVFPGVQSVLSISLLSLFRVGEALAVDEFTYGNLIRLARMAKIRLVPVRGDAEGMLPEALEEAARADGVRGVFLMPACANPTTRTMRGARRDALAQVARARDLFVLEDDAQLGPEAESPLQARIPERTVYLAGTSRLLAAGLRATFAVVPASLCARLLAALHSTAIKASALDAEILGELILNGAAETLLERKRAAARRANAVFDAVFGLAGTADDVRLFRTLPLPGTTGCGQEIERALRAHGIEVFHSDRFRVGTAPADSFLRISVSNARSEKTLASHLRALARKLKGGAPGDAPSASRFRTET